MLSLILTFAFIYCVLWVLVRVIGFILKIALFPVKLVVSLIFAVIGMVLFPAFIVLFLIPLVMVIIFRLAGKTA